MRRSTQQLIGVAALALLGSSSVWGATTVKRSGTAFGHVLASKAKGRQERPFVSWF